MPLYVLATPIGNLSDLSTRAVETLKNSDLVACEDTRVTGKLLSRLEINKEMISYRDENEKHLAPQLADRIATGTNIVLVSDAGTPAISDPGYRLVKECRDRNLEVIPIPGPVAFTTALSASGLPTDRIMFEGFLAPKKAARERFFNEYKTFPGTIVCYESCHRIEKFMSDLIECLGPDRQICIAREITKLHETFLYGTASHVLSEMKKRSTKGEFVVMIAKES
jgi:16S rRNA (cytidine1402-2'-O)-methyltransferase